MAAITRTMIRPGGTSRKVDSHPGLRVGSRQPHITTVLDLWDCTLKSADLTGSFCTT